MLGLLFFLPRHFSLHKTHQPWPNQNEDKHFSLLSKCHLFLGGNSGRDFFTSSHTTPEPEQKQKKRCFNFVFFPRTKFRVETKRCASCGGHDPINSWDLSRTKMNNSFLKSTGLKGIKIIQSAQLIFQRFQPMNRTNTVPDFVSMNDDDNISVVHFK